MEVIKTNDLKWSISNIRIKTHDWWWQFRETQLKLIRDVFSASLNKRNRRIK